MLRMNGCEVTTSRNSSAPRMDTGLIQTWWTRASSPTDVTAILCDACRGERSHGERRRFLAAEPP